ncbi:DegT/DnrJ/EryC1/StrS family aminotransferase [Leeuwenhoekiella sp. NPDC079379]|uniref:DegT/DnrJ/EryC1/StrS family aminotransferase n=1 Tax=Leeuwenhoekiella sp. NPDC079379 TaxID=3364122 RepID=UPI0037CAC302
MTNVTKTFFPPLAEYEQQLQRVWKNEWLTNRGELVLELEEKLKNHLKVPNIILMTNGTLPIQIALKLLASGGEVITTPFSYVATTSALVWEQCTPVFVDIHPDYLTIDETKIEAAITEKTTAILATHVFGNPCNVEAIEAIAIKHNLKVIYDAAHCFGVTYQNKSLFEYGDVSTCSFHATKIFHTGEGGAAFCNSDDSLLHKMYYSHNFGHNGPTNFYGVGINAKISELQAAMGLSVLPYMEHIVDSRKGIVEQYRSQLDFSKLRAMKLRDNTVWNYSYYPIIFESEATLLRVQKELNKADIFPRRYFYPSLNTLDYVRSTEMKVSEGIAECILCLPLYSGLKNNDVDKIIKLINDTL